MAFLNVTDKPIETFFYPHYRAFELISGGFVALLIKRGEGRKRIKLSTVHKEIISYISLGLIIAPMFYLNESSTFPGFNTLPPLLGTVLFILFSHKTVVSNLLSTPLMVFFGLISYPLYLYHQPIISYIYFFNILNSKNSLFIFFFTLLVSVPFSWLTYRYIETPIRKITRDKNSLSRKITFYLIIILSFFLYLEYL
jgi:peptidoglycan/LPS O-acetylase OafA/YrhL